MLMSHVVSQSETFLRHTGTVLESSKKYFMKSLKIPKG